MPEPSRRNYLLINMKRNLPKLPIDRKTTGAINKQYFDPWWDKFYKRNHISSICLIVLLLFIKFADGQTNETLKIPFTEGISQVEPLFMIKYHKGDTLSHEDIIKVKKYLNDSLKETRSVKEAETVCQPWGIVGNMPISDPCADVTTDYTNNLLGTKPHPSYGFGNLPIHFITDGATTIVPSTDPSSPDGKSPGRMMIDKNYLFPYPTYFGWPPTSDPSGFVGIGIDKWIDDTQGPVSPWTELHINGPDNMDAGGSPVWRPWMHTGTLVTENTDGVYFGLKDEITNEGGDRSDAVIAWGDNDEKTAYINGPDNLRFIMSAYADDANTIATDDISKLNPHFYHGREIARMCPNGYMGIGATFTNAGVGSGPPQSLLHLHNAEVDKTKVLTWLQVSNYSCPGTHQATSNGLRIGLDKDPVTGVGYMAKFIQQENAAMGFFTAGSSTAPEERLRIDHGSDLRISRIAINEDGLTNPIVNSGNTTIRSLLHLGYNTSASGDGWRPWMDIGTFYGANNHDMYVGLIDEAGSGHSLTPSTQQDAVVAWGKGTNGLNCLRFIFTSYSGSSGDAGTTNGLEVARMTFDGKMGIGRTWSLVNPPVKKLDVLDPNDAQLRLTCIQNGNFITNPGRYTDFQTTSLGDLAIFPKKQTTVVAYSHRFVGINTYAPGNTLEINSTINSPTLSGLRFTNLTCNSPFDLTPTCSNPFGILSVNSSGDVIYIKNSGNSSNQGFGVCFPGPLPYLFGNSGIDMKESNLFFKPHTLLSSPANNNVGIGYDCGHPFKARLDVLETTNGHGTIGIYVENTDASNPTSCVPSIGIKSKVSNQSSGCTRNIAGWFEAATSNCSLNPMQLAIVVPPGGGTVEFGFDPCTGGSHSLLDVNGNIWSNGINLSSDSTLKTNIQSLNNSLEKVKQLRGVSFNWKLTQITDPYMNGTHLGFISQEVEKIIPDIVHTSVNPLNQIKGLSYIEIIPLLVESVKQLDSTNRNLQDQVNNLNEIINKCCASSGERQNQNNDKGNTIDVLLNSKTIVLQQNVPNPFKEQTTISYFIPDDLKDVKIIFTDATGNVIKEVTITDKGKGQLNVYAPDLSSGIYTYTIISNGITIDSKRMVLTK